MQPGMVQEEGKFSVKEGNPRRSEFLVVWGRYPGELVRSFHTDHDKALARGMSHVRWHNAQAAYDLADSLNEGGAARERALRAVERGRTAMGKT